MSFLRNKKHFVLRTALRRKGRCRCSDLPWAENPARQDSFSFHHRQAAYLYAKSVFAPAFMPRACLKIYSHHLHAPLCGKFGPHPVNAAREIAAAGEVSELLPEKVSGVAYGFPGDFFTFYLPSPFYQYPPSHCFWWP